MLPQFCIIIEYGKGVPNFSSKVLRAGLIESSFSHPSPFDSRTV